MRLLILLTMFGCLLAACSSVVKGARVGANLTGAVGYAAEALIEQAYADALDDALRSSNVREEYEAKAAEIDRTFAVVKDAYHAYKTGSIAFHKAVAVAEEVEEAGGEVNFEELMAIASKVAALRSELISALQMAGVNVGPIEDIELPDFLMQQKEAQ